MALDEAATKLLAEVTAQLKTKPLHEMTVVAARELVASFVERNGSGPEMAEVRNARVPSAGGWVPIRMFIPNRNPRGIVVYYHGGGWVLGGLDECDTFTRQLAQHTSCAVVSVGYRLAPEYRYPTAVEDAWSALQWVADHREEIAEKPLRLIVVGEDAGGNLAAVVARRALERKGAAIALQVLIYPITDCDFDTLSYCDPQNQLLLDRDSMIWFWDHYAPELDARKYPDASPLQAVFLSGLPPAVILTAEHDVLRDEGELYALRLVQAGVPVQHHRFDGQMHGFVSMSDNIPGRAEGMAYIANAIDQYLDSRPPI